MKYVLLFCLKIKHKIKVRALLLIVIIILFLLSDYHTVYINESYIFGCCGCEFTLLSDHFIVHLFCTIMSFFLLWTLKMKHVFFRGLSVNFLIVTLKRLLDILSIFSDSL